VPRAGPLRYWSLTLLGGLLFLGSIAAFGWGLYHLIGTESCGTATTDACSSETGLHIMAVVASPFVGGFGAILFAFRGGRTRWRSEKRVADMVARGEMAPPVVARPSTPAPVLPDGPPATWPGFAPAKPEPTESPIERLQKLDRLKAKGLISAADYESQKKRILGGV
jgi:hypothetical protein